MGVASGCGECSILNFSSKCNCIGKSSVYDVIMCNVRCPCVYKAQCHVYLSVSIFTVTVFSQPSTYRSALASHRYRSTLRHHIWRRVESMGVASRCGCKEVYRFPYTTYPYSSCIYLFYSIPNFCSFFKCFSFL